MLCYNERAPDVWRRSGFQISARDSPLAYHNSNTSSSSSSSSSSNSSNSNNSNNNNNDNDDNNSNSNNKITPRVELGPTERESLRFEASADAQYTMICTIVYLTIYIYIHTEREREIGISILVYSVLGIPMIYTSI